MWFVLQPTGNMLILSSTKCVAYTLHELQGLFSVDWGGGRETLLKIPLSCIQFLYMWPPVMANACVCVNSVTSLLVGVRSVAMRMIVDDWVLTSSTCQGVGEREREGRGEADTTTSYRMRGKERKREGRREREEWERYKTLPQYLPSIPSVLHLTLWWSHWR